MSATTQNPGKFQFAIDRGGTFTDVFARCPDGQVRVMKLLSVDPKNYRDAPVSPKVCFLRLKFHKFLPLLRLKASGGSSKVSLENLIPEMSRLTQPTLNGSGWVPRWRPMRSWSVKENASDSSSPKASRMFCTLVNIFPQIVWMSGWNLFLANREPSTSEIIWSGNCQARNALWRSCRSQGPVFAEATGLWA